VVGGSSVERIAAVDGPTRRRPAKNRAIGVTVETMAMAASHSQPSLAKPVSKEPLAAQVMPNVIAAPVVIRADRGSASRSPPTRSETRM